ncbi:MAG: dihydrodipicolinate synthase family protein [Xanthomonadales bacterium]|nr:dihydrodipicolinate synthase family protein [Xanthomonadales bacterium]
MSMQWTGVMPAITTPFDDQGRIDHDFLAEHARWLVAEGCSGIVGLGSLGEGGTLEPAEREALLTTLVRAVGDQVPVVAAVAALSTAAAVEQARRAEAIGCRGLMVLPPYVYRGTWEEQRAHLRAVIEATPLSCMLYNNPVAYVVDYSPEQIQELAQSCANLHAVKESSTDVRRITALRAILGDRLTLLVGVDDAAVEGAAAGARGWIAGLVNAMPRESVVLWEAAIRGDQATVDRIYPWFLPLLRLDTVPHFVQLIKLVQARVGRGSETVRPPRQVLVGGEREEALGVIAGALRTRPSVQAAE